jgi:hypothetical protein
MQPAASFPGTLLQNAQDGGLQLSRDGIHLSRVGLWPELFTTLTVIVSSAWHILLI